MTLGNFQKLVWVLSALLTVVSCHPKKASERKVLPFNPPSQNDGDNLPLAYHLSNPTCISGTTGLQTIRKHAIHATQIN